MRFLPHWRKATWAVVIWTVLMAFWMIAGSQQTPDKTCAGETGSALELCQSAYHVGTGIGVTLLFVLWFIGFVVLSLVWLMSRPQRRLCPVCGEQVKKGLAVCPKCGYNFAGAARAGSPVAAPVAMPPGVFPCYRCQAPVWPPMTACTACGAPLSWQPRPPDR